MKNPAAKSYRCDRTFAAVHESLHGTKSWGPEQINTRGIKLLKFMEDRWRFRFKSDEEREKLLFLNLTKEAE